MRKITSFLLWGLCVSTCFAADYMINDFESAREVKSWSQSLTAQPDSSPCRVKFSKRIARHGKGCMKVIFQKHAPGDKLYRSLEASVDNGALKYISWKGYKYLKFSIYVEGNKEIFLRFTINDIENHKYYKRFTLNKGWNHIVIPLSALALKNVNLNRVGIIRFYWECPPYDIVWYLDNLHLTNKESKIDAKALQKKLNDNADKLISVARKLKQTAGEFGNNGEKKILPKEHDQKLSLCRESLFEAVLKNTGELTSSSSETDNVDLAVDNLSLLEKQVAAQLAEAKLLQRIRNDYNKPELVIGIKKHPDVDNIRYSPRTHEGKLVRRFETMMAANETKFICMLVIPVKKDLKGICLKASELKQKNGEIIPAQNIKTIPLAYRRLTAKEAYAYLLRPDISKVDIPHNAQQAFWINITTLVGTAPGVYEGNIQITGTNIKTLNIPLKVRVRNFKLPVSPSLPLITTSKSRVGLKDSLDIIAHRCEPGSLYSPEFAPEAMLKWVKKGARYINLMHVDRQGKNSWSYDRKGRMSLNPEKKAKYYKALAARLKILKEKYPSLLDKVYVYGFDEPQISQLSALNDIYGEIKSKYGFKTMFATYLPLWEREEIRNVDYWAVANSILTPANIRYIRKHSEKIFGYNLNSSGPIARYQFWSAFKSELDGLLHYSLNSARDWSDKDAFPIVEAKLGGVRMPDLPKKKNFGTIGFELWRRGSYDHDYMTILKQQIRKCRQRKNLTPRQSELIGHAESLLQNPDDLIPPVHNLKLVKGCEFEYMSRRIEEIGNMIEKLKQEFPCSVENK